MAEGREESRPCNEGNQQCSFGLSAPGVSLARRASKCVQGSEPCVSQLLPADDVQLEEKLCLFLAGRSLSISPCVQLVLHGASCHMPCETPNPACGATIPMALLSLWEAQAHGRCSRSRFSRVVPRFGTGGVQSEAAMVEPGANGPLLLAAGKHTGLVCDGETGTAHWSGSSRLCKGNADTKTPALLPRHRHSCAPTPSTCTRAPPRVSGHVL